MYPITECRAYNYHKVSLSVGTKSQAIHAKPASFSSILMLFIVPELGSPYHFNSCFMLHCLPILPQIPILRRGVNPLYPRQLRQRL